MATASVILLAGCVTTVAGTATRAPNAGLEDVPPLDESDLDDVLLSIGEINGIMGSTTMRITSALDEMTDHSEDVSDPDCLGAIYGAEEPVYAGSGWTEMRDQVAREPDEDNDHWVEQTAVLYPTGDHARDFFEESKTTWQDCANYSIAVDDLGASYLWEIEDLDAEETLLSQLSTQEDADGWACEHALSVVSNVTVEAWACGYTIGDEAATIATDMVANAAGR